MATIGDTFVTMAVLDDDSVLTILTALPGPPTAQAAALVRVRAASNRLRMLADQAAEMLVAEHMSCTKQQLDAMQQSYARQLGMVSNLLRGSLPASLDFDLDGPVSVMPNALQALSYSMPKLPLQWTALRSAPCPQTQAPSSYHTCRTAQTSRRRATRHRFNHQPHSRLGRGGIGCRPPSPTRYRSRGPHPVEHARRDRLHVGRRHLAHRHAPWAAGLRDTERLRTDAARCTADSTT